MSLSASLAIDVFTRLFKLGLENWDALCAKGFDTKDLAALNKVLAATGEALGAGKGSPPEAAAQQVALIMAAFSRAYERHWVSTRSLERPGLVRRFFHRDEHARHKDIEARLRMADLHAEQVGQRAPGVREYQAAGALTANPLATRYYRELWRVFTDPSLVLEGQETPLELESGLDKHALERHFLLAYHQALASRAGQEVREMLSTLEQYRRRLAGQILIADMATWGDRHVFGNAPRPAAPEVSDEPFLSLSTMYVEPDAETESAKSSSADSEPAGRQPVLQRLRAWLADNQGAHVAVVKADFGMGKSLSARMLARELAQAYSQDREQISTETWLPVFIQCGTDLYDDSDSLDDLTRRAYKRHMQDLDRSLVMDEHTEHPDEQRVLYLLDGMDEVVLGQRALEGLFQRLRDQTHARRRALVFSRPGVLPARHELKHELLLALQPFDEARIERWLDAWNRVHARAEPITVDRLRERGLLELAHTPILLFMIADTWDEYAQEAAPSQARLYETFFMARARGKHERDFLDHKPVYRAAEDLLEQLRERGDLSPDARPEEAMLWLLARLAWEERKLAWTRQLQDRIRDVKRPPGAGDSLDLLTRGMVTRLLEQELDINKDAARTIEIGVLLVVQSDPTVGRDELHFGHKSFREFLAARHVAHQLLALARGREFDWGKHSEKLLGARLLAPEDRTFAFLCDFLSGSSERACSPFAWDDSLREKLRQWAEHYVQDERQRSSEPEPVIHDDQRAVWREAALAIGCFLGERLGLIDRGQPTVRVTGPYTMRSLLAWFWAANRSPCILAPGADLRGMRAGYVKFREAVFRKADLRGADLEQSWCSRGDFSGANLAGADLERADLAGANLAGANLAGANLMSANLAGANLAGASLPWADFREADLQDANLRNASLWECNLEHAILEGANLEGANLRAANLKNVGLLGANLAGADLTDVLHDKHTCWPEDFEPPPRP